jgi:HSP20 family protein
MQDLATMFNESLFGGNNNNDEDNTVATKSDDFKPEADVFDTEDSYVIHINLPGAKKEDVGVNWDAEKSELNVAGVIYRPGDEEFLKTLALDERKVGAFERKVRLGSRANPAQVDIEGITAKLEDGVLRVTVPKMNGEFVDVRKVDVE